MFGKKPPVFRTNRDSLLLKMDDRRASTSKIAVPSGRQCGAAVCGDSSSYRHFKCRGLARDGSHFHGSIVSRRLMKNCATIGTRRETSRRFNIVGNDLRLITEISYVDQTVLIRHVLTHAEYDKEDWKK
jgi:HigB_toxin, RelE-like toxic component of a toxin-antitoxin system